MCLCHLAPYITIYHHIIHFLNRGSFLSRPICFQEQEMPETSPSQSSKWHNPCHLVNGFPDCIKCSVVYKYTDIGPTCQRSNLMVRCSCYTHACTQLRNANLVKDKEGRCVAESRQHWRHGNQACGEGHSAKTLGGQRRRTFNQTSQGIQSSKFKQLRGQMHSEVSHCNYS